MRPISLNSLRIILNKRVRFNKRYSVRLWLLLILIVVLITTFIKMLVTQNNTLNTTSTIIDLDMDESLLTKEQITKYPIPLRSIKSSVDKVFYEGCLDTTKIDPNKRANAALVMLARNTELKGVIHSMKSLERRFNQWFNYPWVFLNDEEFTQEFKDTVRKYTNAKTSFGVIPAKDWNFPQKGPELDEYIVRQGDRGVMYGQLESYHKMCRFYSKFFFKHDLVKNLEWYWRVEPDVDFYCDITYDPFLEMAKLGKKYGFNVVVRELISTIPNLFRITKAFVKETGLQNGESWKLFVKDLNFFDGVNKDLYRGVQNVPELIRKIEENVKFNKLKQISDNSLLDDTTLQDLTIMGGKYGLPSLMEEQFDLEEYNLCHFWSNFEIARTDLFDNELYDQFVEYLENFGGFYKERWGDLPVHSLAVGIFTNLSDIHYFRDIGYKHSTLGHCPNNSPQNQLPFTPALGSQYTKKIKGDLTVFNGVGCRCKCPRGSMEIENSGSACMGQWINLTKKSPNKTSKLDIDKIELAITEKFDLYLETGGEWSDWKLTDLDIKLLSKIRV